jgi:hypothetical protein
MYLLKLELLVRVSGYVPNLDTRNGAYYVYQIIM